jgi:hypothetical protein
LEVEVVTFLDALRASAANLDSEAFEKNLGDKKFQLLRMFTRAEVKLTVLLNETHATVCDDKNGNVLDHAMQSHYEAAAKAHRTAQPRAKAKEQGLGVLEARMCRIKSPFLALVVNTRVYWDKTQKEVMAIALAGIEETVGRIQTSYERLGCLQESNDAAVKMRADLERMVKEAKSECKGPIRQDLLASGLEPKPNSPTLKSREIKVAKTRKVKSKVSRSEYAAVEFNLRR